MKCSNKYLPLMVDDDEIDERSNLFFDWDELDMMEWDEDPPMASNLFFDWDEFHESASVTFLFLMSNLSFST